MREKLQLKLYEYISRNNPDLLVQLQEERGVTSYILDKVQSVDTLLDELLSAGVTPFFIEEVCMTALTEDLLPSRYNYMLSILEEEFGEVLDGWIDLNIVKYETLNVLNFCRPLFFDSGFSESEFDDIMFRRLIIKNILEYLSN